jgi:DNA-binding NtrC family response regulator
MPAQVVVTLADLETAVPLDRALGASGIESAVVASADEARTAIRKHHPGLLVFTGAIHEPASATLAAYARDHDVSILALLEPTDSEGAAPLAATEVLVKPVATDELVATVRRMVDRRELQRRTGIFGESAAIQEVLVKIEQMAPVSSTVLIQGE